MSRFSELLGSIGTGQSPAPPVSAQKDVSATQNANQSTNALGNAAKNGGDATKFVTRPAVGTPGISSNGIKRKADSSLPELPDKTLKADTHQGTSQGTFQGTFRGTFQGAPNSAKSSLSTNPVSGTKTSADGRRPSTSTGPAPAAIPKVPPKGSFADIIARAKAAQEQRGQNQVGMIMHQASSKEKVRKRRREEEKTRPEKGRPGHRAVSSGRVEKRRSESPAKKREEPKKIKTPRPPLAAPPSSYTGTLGLPARRLPPSAKNGKRPSKYDEYLGTDEEDLEEEDDAGEEGGYGSDASSDMEAGLMDIDEEEAAALRKAKEDDARELALENKLKREKEEKRRRLQALADKKR